jgi:hypothetical protein
VTGVDVWADTAVNGIRLRSTKATGPVRGSATGALTAIDLAANERVLEISGQGENAIGQLTIKTNLRSIGPLGSVTGPPFRFSAPAGFEISSIRGRVGANATPGGPSTVAAFGISIREPIPDRLIPLEPGRLLDSRPGGSTVDDVSARIGLRSAGSLTEVQVTGRHNISADATSVVLNVTVADPTDGGYVTVWPCGSVRPNASSVNFAAGQTIANAVISKVGTGGRVCIFTSASAHLLTDTTGYYLEGSLTSLDPARLLDSRAGGATIDAAQARIGIRPPGSVTPVQVTGRGGVPADATAVVLNVTATDPTDGGFVTVWPCGTVRPNASSVNFSAGETIANAVISKVGTGGTVCAFTSTESHLIADITGYYLAGSLVPLDPGRLLDSRARGATVDDAQARIGLRPTGSVTQVQVTGRVGVPDNATAVVLNVTISSPVAQGYVTVWPCGAARPNASNVNYGDGDTIANAVISKVGTGGRVCVYTQSATELIVDLAAYDQ